jgi:amidase
MTDLAFTPAVEQARLVREREVSPVELVELYLGRIGKLDGELNAVVTVAADRALEEARAAEQRAGADDAPSYLGVPILIKDLHLTEGIRTTFGCRLFAEFVPPFDEENVARIRNGGFIVLGKTNVPEFGPVPWSESELLGPCRNPWSTEHTPGGSSGGAAAAMAAGLCPVAHGSDGGGSVRIPASNCGLVGLKPSRGRISAGPLFGEMAQGLATVGPLARYTADAAALLDVTSGYAVGDPYWLPDPERPFTEEARTDPPPLRIGVQRTSPYATFHPETLAALDAAVALLTDLGHHVDEIDFAGAGSVKEDFELVWAVGIAALPLDPDALEPFNAALARMGSDRSAPDLARARSSLFFHARQIIAASMALDVVIAPTIAEPPLRVGELAHITDATEMLDRLAQYVGLAPYPNFTGQPAITMPLHWTPEGLPIGVMAIGRPADEATLLQLSGQLERASGWPDRRPPVS